MACNRELSDEVERYVLAQRLFALGARVPVVGELTSLSPWMLRKFYADVMGENPHRGPVPSSTEWYLNQANHIQASLFCQCYSNLKGEYAHSDLLALIMAYEIWLAVWQGLGLKLTLSFDRAWWLTKLIKSGLMKRQNCRVCHGNFLVGERRLGTYRCPRCFKTGGRYTLQRRYLPPREKSSMSASGIA